MDQTASAGTGSPPHLLASSSPLPRRLLLLLTGPALHAPWSPADGQRRHLEVTSQHRVVGIHLHDRTRCGHSCIAPATHHLGRRRAAVDHLAAVCGQRDGDGQQRHLDDQDLGKQVCVGVLWWSRETKRTSWKAWTDIRLLNMDKKIWTLLFKSLESRRNVLIIQSTVSSMKIH